MQEQTNFAYQDKFENVFVHGCGTGFHRQLMASNSLSLGFLPLRCIMSLPSHVRLQIMSIW